MSSIHSSLPDSADDLGLLTDELLPQFHPGKNGGRISLLLTETDLKKRWQEYMEELCKKVIHDPDNHDDVISHLEPDILECASQEYWSAISSSRAPSQPRDQTQVFCIGRQVLY